MLGKKKFNFVIFSIFCVAITVFIFLRNSLFVTPLELMYAATSNNQIGATCMCKEYALIAKL